MQYTVLEEFSGLGDLLGEEEWILERPNMVLSTTTGLSGAPSAKVALAFEGRRHVMYYAIRIFMPMLVLIACSWALFLSGRIPQAESRLRAPTCWSLWPSTG